MDEEKFPCFGSHKVILIFDRLKYTKNLQWVSKGEAIEG